MAPSSHDLPASSLSDLPVLSPMSDLDEPNLAPDAPRRRAHRTRHLLDRLYVVRSHWLASGLVFTLIVGVILYLTLRASPRYDASAKLTIESSSGTGILGDLASLGKPSKVETEMEVLRSFTIARGAARILAGLPAHPLPGSKPDAEGPRFYRAVVEEENAYRPWEVLLRGLGRLRDACPLEVQTDVPPTQPAKESFQFEFDATGTGLRVSGGEAGKEGTDHLEAVEWGRPFQARGRTFVVDEPSGDVTGRRYDVVAFPIEHAAERMFLGVKVNPVGRFTDVVEIVYSAPTPTEAQAGATALAQSYLELRRIRRQGDVVTSQEWLQGEIKRLTMELGPLERDLDEYIRKNNAVLLSEQTTSILDRQVQLRTQLAGLERERAIEEGKLQRLESGKESDLEHQAVILGPEGVNSITTALSDRYADLRRERAALQRKGIKAESPELRDKEAEIKETREELEKILLLALGDRIVSQQREVASLKAQIASLNEELKAADDELAKVPEKERGLAKAKEQIESRRALLARYTEKEMELKSAGNTGDGAATLVDAARLPITRSSPNLMRMGLLALFLGLLAGVGTAFFLESLDHSIRNPDQIEEGTGLTVYASIPAFNSVMRKDRVKLKTALVTAEKPNSVLTEASRTLRANIRFANADRKIQTFASTSSLPQEGKSTTTCNLAVVFAQGGSRTLIVDADMRRPSTHLTFGGARAPGLSDVLKGNTSWRTQVTPTQIENLSLLRAGTEVGNPGALLDSSAFSRMLAELKTEYDYILFDVPPVLAVADAASFFRSLDGILLLTRYGRCPVDVVDGAREQIERLGGRLLGGIFNAIDVNRAFRRGYGYYGYYGYRARYGSYGGDAPAPGKATPATKSKKSPDEPKAASKGTQEAAK